MVLEHVENEHPWDKPVPEAKWPEIVGYCENDVDATDGVLDHLMTDFKARQMMAELSGLVVNEPLRKHAERIILKGDRNASDSFEYTDLSEMFPGYQFELGKSSYKDVEEVGEGGYVYEEVGMYEDVAVLDISSMHPASMIALNLFGPYTKNFEELMRARLFVKRGDFASARLLFDGKLAPYLEDEDAAEELSYALKIIINSIYGFTAASFDNPFRDKRNKDNIVAKRGALFMIDLMEFIRSRGFSVIHTKTDSVKIPGATKELIEEIMEFAHGYGYNFEHEGTYDKFCLINKADYIGHMPAGRKPAHWEAIGTKFKHPYVFKKLFSKDKVQNSDLCETKSVKTKMYLDFTPDTDKPMALVEDSIDEKYLHFVGKVGRFVPVSEGGGYLLREKDGALHAATGSKGHKWREAESVETTNSWGDVDYTYFNRLAESAIEELSKHGDFEWFVGDSSADERIIEEKQAA